MPRILIVDDEEVDRELAGRCLRTLPDLEILEAEEGEAALASIEAHEPDLVLTDLRMPGMDGLALVEKVRVEHPLLPLVLMTSKGNERIAAQALRAGAASYVPKSEMKEMLLDSIESVLEVTEAQRSQRQVLDYLGSSELRFELVNDPALISPLVGFLQNQLAQFRLGDESMRTQIGMVLMEAVSNGMIHGNLEIDSALRRSDPGAFYDLVEARRGQPPYAERRLRCTVKQSAASVEYTVRDEGPGFDPATLPDPNAAENLLEVSGRGLLLIRTFMDEVTFNDRGNRITMTKNLPARAAAKTD
jgi:CheY-like chemotaxis protein/anti-sigma regulatory factor (Ser/Thr protein kinase)